MAICLLGGYSIAGYLKSADTMPWIPYLGGLLGLIGAVVILGVEKQIKKEQREIELDNAAFQRYEDGRNYLVSPEKLMI